jgi:hypothetical protein
MFVISLAAAGAALAVASPAAAQYYPQQQPYGYGGQQSYGYGAQRYGNGYGYNGYGQNNYGQVRSLQARIDAVQYRLRYLGRGYGGRGNSANGLREESRNIEQRLRYAGRNGLNPYEANDIQNRIARLEQSVNYAMAGRNGRYGYSGYNGYNSGNGYNAYNNNQGYSGDRNRDGRDHGDDNDQGHDRDD